jgi:hypothetical protein
MMKYLLLISLLAGCMIPPPSGRIIPQVVNEPLAPDPITDPQQAEPEPKKRLPTKVITIIEKPLPPCDVTQDSGQKQIIETMDCLIQDGK